MCAHCPGAVPDVECAGRLGIRRALNMLRIVSESGIPALKKAMRDKRRNSCPPSPLLALLPFLLNAADRTETEAAYWGPPAL